MSKDNIHKIKKHKHYESLHDEDEQSLISSDYHIAKPKVEQPEVSELNDMINRSATSSGILNSVRYAHKCPIHSSVDDIKTEMLMIESDHYAQSALKVSNTPGIKGPQGTKCFYDNEKFDSLWEVAFYIYYKYIECSAVKRNHDDFIAYIDHDGKQRKFYYDFSLNGGASLWEVKGIFRPSDIAKKECCPQVNFIDRNGIKPIIEAVNKRFPNWKKDIIKR